MLALDYKHGFKAILTGNKFTLVFSQMARP
jgi:hypothetical protein